MVLSTRVLVLVVAARPAVEEYKLLFMVKAYWQPPSDLGLIFKAQVDTELKEKVVVKPATES